MAELNSLSISIFCENIAMMLGAGITPDEAVSLLADDAADIHDEIYLAVLKELNKSMIIGSSFSQSVKESGVFPQYAADMIIAGEQSGKLEQVMKNLSAYYRRSDAMKKKLKSCLTYPIILLLMMCAVLIIMNVLVMPVFGNVYKSLSGSLASSSFRYIGIAKVISIISLVFTLLVCAVTVCSLLAYRTEKGKEKLDRLMEKAPILSPISKKLSVARFTDMLSTFIASGMDTDTAMSEALTGVTHNELKNELGSAYKEMIVGKSLAEALFESRIYDPLYGRMLISASRSGKLDSMLVKLAEETELEAEDSIDRLISTVEPVLTGFLTIIVGVTLMSIMLPLAGMLGAIG
ncbi:MAG: type II secretion system F family protein [Clostridia bacterium]|nr:type II secretion system F family protein [Clostridia bacterium]